MEDLSWLELGPGDRIVSATTHRAPWSPGWRWPFKRRTILSLLPGFISIEARS